MNPQQLISQGRSLLVQELNIAHLSEAEQNNILDGLGEVLLRRVLLKLFQLLPESELDNFQKLLESEDGAAAQSFIEKSVPNASEIIRNELREGVGEHKRLVRETIAKR